MKILITGGTGFIGRNLVEHLSVNHEVALMSRNKLQQPNSVHKNLLEVIQDEDVFEDYEVILHCASVLATKENNENLDLFYDNLKITNSLIAIVRKVKPKLVINFSTIGVYPNLDGEYDENSSIRPSVNFEGLYGLSKFCSEELMSFYYGKSSVRIVNLRLGQTIGKGMREDRIYSIMKEDLRKSNIIKVYGNGERISAFLSIDYLKDTVDKIIQYESLHGTFNLTEKNLTYLELAQQIIQKYGNDNSEIKLVPNGSNSKVIINSNKIKNYLDD